MSAKLTQHEADAARERLAQGMASAAVEGIFYTDEEKALFERFHRECTPFEERGRIIDEFIDRKVQEARQTRKTA